MKTRSAKSSKSAKNRGAARRSKAGRGGTVAKVMRPAEVCAEFGIQPYVLKFWENEFPQLGGRIGSKREYGPKELKLVRAIHTLIEEQRLTLADARQALDRTFPRPGGRASARETRPAAGGARSNVRAGAPPARVRELEDALARVMRERDRFRDELERLERRGVSRRGETSEADAHPDDRLLSDLDGCLEEARELAQLSERLLMVLAPSDGPGSDGRARAARSGAARRRSEKSQAGLFTSKK